MKELSAWPESKKRMKRNNFSIALDVRRLFRTGGLIFIGFLFCLSWQACSPGSEEDYFTRVDKYFDESRFEKAVSVCREYLQDYPEGKYRDKALFRAGEILYFALVDHEAGKKELNKLISEYPTSEFSYKAHDVLGSYFRDELRDFKRAIVEYKFLIIQKPDNPKAAFYQFQVARCYVMAGQLEKAIRELGTLIEKYPDSDLAPPAYDELAGAYLALDRPDTSYYIFSKLLERHPQCSFKSTVEFKIGHCLEEMNRFKEAIDIYKDLLPKYHNPRAIEIRMAGVEERRRKKRLGSLKVDYSYRPKAGEERKLNREFTKRQVSDD